MYLLFLTSGAVVGAAGVILAISGLSLRDGTFDAAVFTPGIVTAIGGFLVVGLGVGLRTLQRIEQALASRPTLRASLSGATADTAETGDVQRETARVLFPRKAGRLSQPVAAPSVPGLGNDSGDLEEQSPDSASRVDKITPFLPPIAAANEMNPDMDAQRFGKQGNATVAASGGERSMPVSTLKSGVVNGMAYILYSDGSIEAQLPEGTLRFGSITELRNHIEHSA
jgi:hypothetical protein